MKTILIQILTILLLNIACSSKKEHHETGEHHNADSSNASHDKWAEMDAFHSLMAESFHPYKDSANLEPAKMLASQMAQAAEQWSKAPLPEKVNNDDVKSRLQKLQEETAAFSQIASNADDKTIGDSLTKLHDLFHELQEAWYSGTAGHEGHH